MDVPLILLAAGRSTRFGTLKQVAPVGPGGASILAYTVLDALVAGFSDVVLVVRPEIEREIRDHLDTHLGPGLPVRFVYQTQPLGTAHATLLGLEGLDGPAGIANGDDAYGRVGLRALRGSAAPLAPEASGGPVRCALVAYPIARTLSEHGGVSRGWVQVEGEVVRSIDEIYDVRSTPEASARLVGRTASGAECSLPDTALGSMNLWMLGAGIRPLLEREFGRFQAAGVSGEFALSTVLDRLREAGDVEIRVAGQADGWFGLTFAADLPAATSRMAVAHRDGQYGEPLSTMVDSFRYRLH